jgi:hypothetical protein
VVETETKKTNIATKMILELSVAIVVEKHFEVNIATIKVNNHMAIIQVQVGKNIIEDVLFLVMTFFI